MEKTKKIFTICGIFLLISSFGILSATDLLYSLNSETEGLKSVQTQTKSTQTNTKPAQTKAKSAQTKSKTTQKSTKTEPVKKVKEPGTLIIGNQTWAEANLNVCTFRNGDTIPEAKTNKEWVAAGESGKPAWCYYNNDPAIGKKYGKLYNWFALNDPRGLAPAGWTLSSDADWTRLVNYLGGPGTAGSKLKSTSGWNEGSVGTNDTGFSGFPGGYRVENGIFQNIGSIGIWWTTIEYNPLSALDHYLAQSNSLARSNSPKQRGESVRCIKQ
jgi:uncharacterized protein (TIGR02145 family)